MLKKENPLAFTDQLQPAPGTKSTIHFEPDLDRILFKYNRMYTHNILRINYTTYDVRRAQDTINPKTSHCNALFLGEDHDSSGKTNTHMFAYGRIIGIHHVNVIYTGLGMLDYSPRRVEFLWVRWFEQLKPFGSWASHRVDRLRFLPITSDAAFSFVDPTDVVRSCHILPAFSQGVRYRLEQSGLSLDGSFTFVDPPNVSRARNVASALPRGVRPAQLGLSSYARDSGDWNCYYVNRCVIYKLATRHISSNPTTDLWIVIC